MLNLVVLDILVHSDQLHFQVPEELRIAFRIPSRCKEEQLLWSRSLLPSTLPTSLFFSASAILRSLYLTMFAGLDYTIPREVNESGPLLHCSINESLGVYVAPEIPSCNNPSFRFNLPSLRQNPRRTVMTYSVLHYEN